MIPHAFPANETNNINEHKVLIMSPIFTVIIIILALLAILDLIVGVANDAVNFLNSALGAKVAPMKVILGVAAVGILLGVVTSNGMMEVARKGVFYPEMFTFTEIMISLFPSLFHFAKSSQAQRNMKRSIWYILPFFSNSGINRSG